LRKLIAIALLCGCSFPTPWGEQRDYARQLEASKVQPVRSAEPLPVRTMKVRAYVDEAYQMQTPRWNAHIEEQLARASDVLEAQFGVRLESSRRGRGRATARPHIWTRCSISSRRRIRASRSTG
jgi:hypothetical protein